MTNVTMNEQGEVIEQKIANPSQLAIATARLAENLGYEGSLTIGTLEDEIRFYQQRTAEACIEMGKRLLILKEMCPHGEFATRLDMLGFAPRTAQKFMQAVLKLSNTNTYSLLKTVDSQSKLLELVTLDDDDLEALSNGESVGNITLDDIETMSVRELKKALKEARSDAHAKDELLAGKDRKINELDSKLSVRKGIDSFKAVQMEVEQHIQDELAQSTASLMTAISQFNAKIEVLQGQASEHVLPHIKDKIDSDINTLYQRIAQVGFDIGVDLNEIMHPSWADQDSDDSQDFELQSYTEADLNAKNH
ncbi:MULTISPECIES: DUF3102 domain-containing protein [unclassified Acinetobacter]|uniref:DUF3102 domain-containing protein n=1 Tax=unclassified Acinetobacter TaxID=196816 RepID=UPI0035BA126C